MNGSFLRHSTLRVLCATGLLLLLPLLAMQFTQEVRWSVGDFAVAGILLFATGMSYRLGTRLVSRLRHRVVMGAALMLVLLTVWAELAVGIFT